VQSEPGAGATFKVYLPCAMEPATAGPIVQSSASMPTGAEAILIVEDELAVRLLMRRILENAGYHVMDAPNPEQALALDAQHGATFQLLLTDVIMPGLSGPRLFETLRGRHPNLKVLYVSGYTDDTIRRHGELAAGARFVQKPFTADGLLRRIREALDARHSAPGSPNDSAALAR
jgi:CheY-like chemotaxis protein